MVGGNRALLELYVSQVEGEQGSDPERDEGYDKRKDHQTLNTV